LDKLELVKILLQLIPPGKVTSYSELSKITGWSPRSVGKILSKNDEPILVPCHRVVMKNGNLGGYSAFSGKEFKRRLLELEGVEFCSNGKIKRSNFCKLSEIL
jgi:methylated-DNA-[protein]-cysteine S-methyltransferase